MEEPEYTIEDIVKIATSTQIGVIKNETLIIQDNEYYGIDLHEILHHANKSEFDAVTLIVGAIKDSMKLQGKALKTTAELLESFEEENRVYTKYDVLKVIEELETDYVENMQTTIEQGRYGEEVSLNKIPIFIDHIIADAKKISKEDFREYVIECVINTYETAIEDFEQSIQRMEELV